MVRRPESAGGLVRNFPAGRVTVHFQDGRQPVGETIIVVDHQRAALSLFPSGGASDGPLRLTIPVPASV